MKQRKAVGIIGGMGPSASSYMYNMLIKQSIQYFHAKNNDDFPEIILYSIPVPDFISSEDRKQEALNMLIDRVKQFNFMPISNLAIACNTAHILIGDLQNVANAPFISMINTVVDKVHKDKLNFIGLLGTPTTIRLRLYQKELQNKGIKTFEPSDKQLPIIEKVIRNVISGSTTVNDTKSLIAIANDLKSRGAQGIILGCTELPLVFPSVYSVPIYNSVEILSLALLQEYYNSNTI